MLALLGVGGEASAAACTTATTGGNWNTAGNWTCVPGPNHVPVAADTVTINRNFTVNVATANVVSITMTAGTLTQSSAMNTAGTLSLSGGTLNSSAALTAGGLTITGGTFNSTNTMTINGDTSITNGTLNLNATTGTHNFNGDVAINANGSWDSTGVNENYTIQGSLSRAATGTFTSANGTYTFSGDGSWSGSPLIFTGNVAITGAGTDRTNSATVSISGTLAVTTASLTNSGTLTVGGNVTVTGTLRNDAGTLTMNGGTGITVNGGTFQIEGGTVNVGNANNERVVLQNNAATTFLMNGGTLNVAGRITNSAAAGQGSFTLNNGTITVGTSGNTQNNVLGAPFFIASNMNYTLAGGSIIIEAANTTANAREYDVNSALGNSTITGGTVQIGNASTPAGQTFQIDSVPPLFNLTVNATNDPATTLLSDITVSNALTLNGTGAFTVGANTLTLNGPSIAGTPANLATTATSSLTFGGSSASVIVPSSVTQLDNLTINNANGITLNSSPTVNGTLTFTSGNLNTTNVNTLTMATAAPAIVGAATSQHVVGNLAKVFPAVAGAYTFAVGDGTNYTPVTITFPVAPTSGTLTVSTPNTSVGDHPDTSTWSARINPTKSVNRYWRTVKDATLAGTYDVTVNYIATDLDSGATATNFVIGRGTGCTGSGVTLTCPVWTQFATGTHTTTQADTTGITITAGAAEEDLVVGEAATPRFSREKEFVYTRERY
jgi:hypothetical protein